MNIKSMALQNFKGVTDTIDIKQHNIFLGGNGSGKSGRVLAPMLAIMGHTHKGDTMETTAEFAGHEGCSVTLDFDDGFCFRRSLIRDHYKGSNSMKLDIKGHGKIGLRESERIVAEHVGTFALMFDVKLFLGWSPEARRNYILGLSCGGEYEFNRLELEDRIGVEFCRLQLGNALVDDAFSKVKGDLKKTITHSVYADLCEKMPDDVLRAFVVAASNISAELKDDLIKSIAGALGQAKQQMNASRQAWDAAEKTSETLTAQKSELATITESVDDLTAKLKQLTYCKEQAIEAHGKSLGVRRSVVSHRNSIHDIDNSIEDIVESLKNMKPCNPDEIKSKIDANQRNIEELDFIVEPEGRPSTLVLIKKQVSDHDLEQLAACVRARNIELKVDSAKQEEGLLVKKIVSLENDPWNKAEGLIKKIDEYIPDITLDEWVELRKIIFENADRSAMPMVKEQLATCKNQIDDLMEDHQAAIVTADQLEERKQESLKEFNQAESDYNDAQSKHASAIKEVARLENENTELKKTIDDHTSFVEKHHDNEKNLREQRDGHELAIKRLEADFCDTTVGQIQGDIEDLKEKIEAVEKRLEDKRELAGLSKRIQECIEQAKAQQVMHEVCKKQFKAIQNVRENYMQELIAPLIENMDRFLWHATSNRRAYCDLVNANGKAIFELGEIIDDEYRVSLNALSGAESTVYCAALAYALVVLADPPLKLLILELAETDIITFNNLLDAIVEVCGEDIQTFVASHTTESLVDRDWNVVSLPSRPDHVLVNRTMDTSKSNVTEDATNACVAS